jgi:hypothetical protein
MVFWFYYLRFEVLMHILVIVLYLFYYLSSFLALPHDLLLHFQFLFFSPIGVHPAIMLQLGPMLLPDCVELLQPTMPPFLYFLQIPLLVLLDSLPVNSLPSSLKIVQL